MSDYYEWNQIVESALNTANEVIIIITIVITIINITIIIITIILIYYYRQ